MEVLDPRRRDEARHLAERAAEWLLALEDGEGQVRDSFTAWIAESPLHVEAFLRASAMDSLLGRIDPARELRIDLAAVGSEISNTVDVLPLTAASPPGRGTVRAGTKRPALLAAGLGALALGAALVWQLHLFPGQGWTEYTTAIGEQRVIEMDDGSVLHINTGSRVEVRFAADERCIRLLEGEAMFRVHHDAQRPFRVYSGDSMIQALGTVFNVRRQGDDAVVSVIEGLVQVNADDKPVRLAAGEQVHIGGNRILAQPTHADVTQVSAWRQRRLIFVDERLAAIAAEFNRYNRTPKIHIADAVAGERRYAAAFDADDPESLLTVLRKDPTLEVEQREDELLIRTR